MADVTRADRLSRLFCCVLENIVTPRALARAGNDLSASQFAGLQFIYLHPHSCIKDLARGLGVSHPAAVKLVERLEARKLIRRSARADDHRVVELSATSSGSRKARSIMKARAEHIGELVAASGVECSGDLLACLEAFIRAALKDERDVNGVCLRCGGSHDDECPVCKAELALTGHLRDCA